MINTEDLQRRRAELERLMSELEASKRACQLVIDQTVDAGIEEVSLEMGQIEQELDRLRNAARPVGDWYDYVQGSFDFYWQCEIGEGEIPF